MKKFKYKKALIFFIIAVLIIQVGIVGYTMMGGNLFGKEDDPAATTAGTADRKQIDGSGNSGGGSKEQAGIATVNNTLKDEADSEISQDILDLIKSSDPDNYTRNVDNYKKLLKDLNVHTIYKNEIERLIKAGYQLPDILTAYSFLNDCYGSMTDIEVLVKEKKSGDKWADIFLEYDKKHPEFVPSNFDSKYLDKLLKTTGIDQDDVMIADRVSQNAKVDFADVINKKIQGLSWRLINAQYGIVNGLEESPHLAITGEQLAKYTNQTQLTEEQVIKALTIADKLGLSADSVLKSVKQGLTREDIYSAAYQEKFY
ncbi:MAG TPA: hypothetical protein VHP38_12915 [Ruminiclostridium sp.]|nr:hypothetical protein [Ruminiclostridium sp.]